MEPKTSAMKNLIKYAVLIKRIRDKLMLQRLKKDMKRKNNLLAKTFTKCNIKTI